ncbi:MAG: hypothetical protein KF823_14650 [Xanthomonadales bacterium]|nr:hypothetical protein [Xanthomonadales bacterium]
MDARRPDAPPEVPERPALIRSNAFSLLVVLVRVGALYLLIAALTRLAPLLWDSVRSHGMAPTLIGVLVLLIIGAVLWLFADVVARAALAGPNEPRFESTLDYGQWQALAFSAIGLWLLVDGLLDLVWVGVEWWRAKLELGAHVARLAPQEFAALVTNALQAALGIALLLGHRGLVGLLARLRG